jgi:hypothetical protein
MRYFKSWLFDAGLALLIAGVATTQFVGAGESHVLSHPPDEAITFNAEYTDTNYALPIAWTFNGLVVAIVAASRVK